MYLQKEDHQMFDIDPCDEILFLEKEIDASDVFKKDCKLIAIEHLLGENDLLKTGTKLTLDEKKALNLNPRMKFTKEFLEILTDSAINSGCPKGLVWNIRTKARVKHYITTTITQAKACAFMTELKFFSSCNVDRDCSWCISQHDIVFSTNVGSEEIIRRINENCTCDPITRSCIVWAK